MIKKISASCARNIILSGNLHETKETVLEYGCELILTSFIGTFILIVMSIIIGRPLAWVYFLLGFAPHRTVAGGYHADTHSRCYIVTSSMFLIGCAVTYKLIWNRYAYLGIALFSALLIASLAPVEAGNKPLSEKRFQSNRIRSFKLVSINFVIALYIAVSNLISNEANMYYAGIFFASASLIIGKIKNSRRKLQ